MLPNLKQFCKENEADIILVIGVILISLIGFGGGWLLGNSSNYSSSNFGEAEIEEVSPEELQASIIEAGKSKEDDNQAEKTAEENETQQETIKEEIAKEPSEQKFVASKNGEVYHYPWCSGAQQIKEENKIYFNSKEEAEKAGYRPARNCPGL